MRRRTFLSAGIGSAAALALPGCASPRGPIDAADVHERLQAAGFSWLGLVTSLPEEHDYLAEVEGRIPDDLRGSLYCNGPGLFERGGQRKRAILDGDGMLRCFDFGDGGVRFRNRYIRTAKLEEEEAADAYRYATWTTQAPGGRLANLLGAGMANQAGVSVHRWHDRLYAFDESWPPYEIDPESLATTGVSRLGLPEEASALFAAHPKLDGRTGEWVHFGLEYGRFVTANIMSFRPDGSLGLHRRVVLPRYAYVHDWFVTERHVVFNVHPAMIRVFDFLSGGTSLVGAMRWEPERGNVLIVVPRHGSGEPILIETEAHWMWHALNAYDRGGEIVADCVAHEGPAAFLGEDPVVFAVMEGRPGARSTGRVLRLVIDPAAGRVRTEVVSEENNEFPMLAPDRVCHPHRYGYFARGPGTVFWRQVLRFDLESGRESVYDFGDDRYCLEPVFAPDPSRRTEGSGPEHEPGWLLTVVYDGRRERSFLAVLRADRLADGPVARIWLRHHLPMHFHGRWYPA